MLATGSGELAGCNGRINITGHRARHCDGRLPAGRLGPDATEAALPTVCIGERSGMETCQSPITNSATTM